MPASRPARALWFTQKIKMRMWSAFNERLVIMLPSHLVEMIHLTLTRRPVVKIVLSWWTSVCVRTDAQNNIPFPSRCLTHNRSVSVKMWCSPERCGKGPAENWLCFFCSGADKKEDVVLAGYEEEKKGGRCVQRFSQLAFSLCTHALILLFSTVPRTAEVRITPSPPFNATDTIHAQIEQ